MITVQCLTFRYPGNQTYALRQIDLSIQRGEFVVIVGKSGCGKSTLALALGGYLFNQYPDEISGTVWVDDQDAQHAPLYEISDRVGLVQQNAENQFCTLTVLDELVFGLENRCLSAQEINERLEWALQVTNCYHLLDRSLASLSGGEKQKIAIAAMLAARPQVLIFDEPTSNLDPSATIDIFEVLDEIRWQTEITVIVIEHKINFLRKFHPRLIEMQEGCIINDQPLDTWQQPVYEPETFPVELPRTSPLLSIKNLQAGYSRQPMVQDISLDVYPGEFIAVMGDNGSGKSTLLQAIVGLLPPFQGSVIVEGMDTRSDPVSRIARSVGVIFQNPAHQLFTHSVWEETIFAPKNFGLLDEASLTRANQLLYQAGLEARKHDHPFRLSYGQMRRLNLISILSYQPQLYLLDEILIGQDIENAKHLLAQLQAQINQGAAVIMVIHNPEIVSKYATRLLFMENGRLLFDLPVEAGFDQLKRMGKRYYLPGNWSNHKQDYA